MARYHFRKGGTIFGPLTDAELREFAQRGEITAACEVRVAGTREWLPAVEVHGLLTAGHTSEPDAVDGISARTSAVAAAGVGTAHSVRRSHGLENASSVEIDFFNHLAEQPAEGASEVAAQADHKSPQPPAVPRLIMAACYLAAAVAGSFGTIVFVKGQSAPQEILGVVCWLLAVVSLASGCVIGLLIDLCMRLKAERFRS